MALAYKGLVHKAVGDYKAGRSGGKVKKGEKNGAEIRFLFGTSEKCWVCSVVHEATA